jgi:hypothetical protein
MPSTAPATSAWCPPEITAAAVPLADIGRLMRALSDDRTSVVELLRSSPLHETRDALEDFLRGWMLALYRVSGEANSLATNLRWAAEDYVANEGALVRGLVDH